MAKTRDYMDYLDENIEIAPANSQEEYQAAQTIAEVMRDHGLETSVEEFEAASMSSLLPHILVILAIVALVACGLTEGIVHVVTLIIGLLFMGLVLYSHFVSNLFENFGPTVRSQNVVGIHRATGSKVVKGARPIVVVAHYDTPRENFLWKGALASQQALLRRTSVICYITIAVCTLFQALSFVPNVVRMVVWAIGLIAGLPLILLAVSDIAERFSSCTIGANNNKASVAALLSLVNVIRPQQDRVDGRDTSKPARRRASDPVEPKRTAPKTHTEVEEVKGIRHGRETLMALGILPPSCEIMYEEPKVRIVEDEPEVEEELTPVAELPEAPESDVDVDDVDFEDYEEEDFDEESEDELDDFDEFDEEDEFAEEADEAEDLDEEVEDEEFADEAGDEDLEDIDEDELEDYDEEEEDVDEEDFEEESEEDALEEEDLEEYEDEESDEEEYDEDLEDYDEDDYDDDEDWGEDFDDESESGKSGGASWFAAKIAGIKEFFSGRKKGNGNIEIERGADRTLDEADDVYDDDEDYEDELGEDYEWDEDEYVDEEEELDEDVEEEVIEEDLEDDEEYEYVDADDIDLDDDEYEYIEYIEYVEYEEEEDEEEIPEDDAYEGYERYARIEEDENPQPAPLTAPAPVPVDIPIIGEQPSEANDEATQELEENAEPQEEAVVKPALSLDSLPMIELEDESEEEVFEVEEDQEDVEVVYEDEPQYEEEELLEEEEVVEEQADWGYEDLYEDEDEYVDEEEPLYEETYEEEAVEEEPYEEEEVLEDVYEEDVPDDGYVYEDDEELVEEEEYVSSEYDDTYSDLYEQDSVDTYEEEEEQYVADDASDLYSSASVGTSLGQRLKGVFRRMRGADQGSFISEEEEEVAEDSYEEDDYATDTYEDTVSASNPYEDEAYDDEGYLTDTYEPQAYEPEVREEETYEEQYYEDDSYDDNVEEKYAEEYEDEYEEYDDEGDSEWYDYEYEDEEVEHVEEEPVEEEVVENAEEPTKLADPNLLHFDREEDDDILPRDTTGLDMYTDPYDVYPRQDVAETSRQRPAAMDDPTWGTASYQPARPVMNIARRAALFDLPDPSKAAFDPLASEYDDEEYDEYDDDGRNNNWKGGAAVRSDLRDGDETDEPLVIDADDLQDAILELGDDYLLGHDIWFVATGASAYDHAGIKAFVDEHRRDFRGSFLINLESIGAGDLTILTNEGFHAPRRADRRIVRMIADIARDLHIPIKQSSYNWDETEATTAMRARVRATTIMGMDEKGQPAYAHTSDDLPENIDANKVSAVVRIVSELIRRA